MKIISTNIGKKRLLKWNGKEIYTGIYKFPVDESLQLERTDVAGDDVMDRKYHGGEDKACYLYSADHYPFWQSKFPNLNWQFGMFGENLTAAGLDESQIHIGDIFKIGNTVVQITQPRQPCFKLGIRLENPSALKMFVDAEKPGTYVRILESGIVRQDDLLELIERKEQNYTLKEIFHFLYHAESNLEQIKKAIEIEELAESCRIDLIKNGKLDV